MPKRAVVDIVAIPVAISKHEMGSTAQWIGFVNTDAVECESARHAPGVLRFQGFFGALHLEDGLYHGEYRFVRMKEPDTETYDLLDVQSLPGLTVSQATEPPIVADELPHDEEGE